MSRITFNTRPVLNAFAEGMTLVAMAGLTAAGAAAWAVSPEPSIPRLPTVVVTAKAPQALPQLPLVIVTAKRTAVADAS